MYILHIGINSFFRHIVYTSKNVLKTFVLWSRSWSRSQCQSRIQEKNSRSRSCSETLSAR